MQEKLKTEAHTRHILRPEDIRAQQKADAEKQRAAVQAKLPALVPDTATPGVVSVPAVTSADDYLAAGGEQLLIGRPLRFNGKTGKWQFTDVKPEEELPPNSMVALIYPAAWLGWVRLQAGAPAVYAGGRYFDPAGYTRPARAELGDLDAADWPEGKFGGNPDPWLETLRVPVETHPAGDLATLILQYRPRVSAKTGKLVRFYACDTILTVCNAERRRHPDTYPVMLLGQRQLDNTFGTWVPTFVARGRIPAAGVAKPDATSLKNDLDDSVDHI